MSISNQSGHSKNPAVVFLQYNSDKETFVYYDKDKKENVAIPLPFSFIVMDRLATITGWCESLKTGVFSNEVHNTTKEQLNVRTFKGGIKKVGFYSEIKGEVIEMGGKYTASLYVMPLDGEFKGQIVNLQLKGASLMPWIEAQKNGNTFMVRGVKTEKKGRVTFTCPVFEDFKATEDQLASAIELDKALQAYLVEYKTAKREDVAPKTERLVDKKDPVEWSFGEKIKKPTDDLSDLPF
jgi:hypothetical protein